MSYPNPFSDLSLIHCQYLCRFELDLQILFHILLDFLLDFAWFFGVFSFLFSIFSGFFESCIINIFYTYLFLYIPISLQCYMYISHSILLPICILPFSQSNVLCCTFPSLSWSFLGLFVSEGRAFDTSPSDISGPSKSHTSDSFYPLSTKLLVLVPKYQVGAGIGMTIPVFTWGFGVGAVDSNQGPLTLGFDRFKAMKISKYG